MTWTPEAYKQAKKSCVRLNSDMNSAKTRQYHHVETIKVQICINEFSAAMMICHITSLWYGMSQPISYIDSTLIMQGRPDAWIALMG